MTKRRGNGEGCIRQLKSGYWEGRIMVGWKENGKPNIKTFSGKRKSDIIKKLNDYRMNKGVKTQPPLNATVAQWLNRWYEDYVIKNVKTSTRVSYEGIINHHLIPHIGGVKITDLKKVNIEHMYNELVVNGRVDRLGGLSVKTVRNISLVLHKALEEAVQREMIDKNPASIANVPTMRSMNVKKKNIEILTKDEQRKLIAACPKDVYGYATLTALFTGVRLGELLAIQWKDIDFDSNTVEISKQVNRLKDYSENPKAKTQLGIQYNTKTSSSNRKITLSDELVKKLIEHRAIQEEQRKMWGNKYNDMNMVFARYDGGYIDPSTFRDKYRDILSKADLKKFTVHALRHTFASRALELNVPIKVVSQILGHATVQITMDTYSHVLPEYQSEVMNRIANSLK